MVESLEPVSYVLWAIALIAAGIYPLGIMLGASCSPCCESDCEETFFRCLRQKSVSGSTPTTPSRTIYHLDAAGIVKASSYVEADFSFYVDPHKYLCAGEQVDYTLEAQPTSSVAAFIPCNEDTKQLRKVRVIGRDFPLKFADTSFDSQYAASATLSGSKTLQAEAEQYVNASATVTASVVAARVTGSGASRIDGAELTDAVLRGMLTVGQPYFVPVAGSIGRQARFPRIDLALSGSGSIFRYMTSPVTLSWLVKVERGSTTTYLTATAFVWPTTPTPLPDGGLTPLSLSPWPTVSDSPEPLPITPTASGTIVTVYAHRTAFTRVELRAKVDLDGPCTLGVQQMRLHGPTESAGTLPPEQYGTAFAVSDFWSTALIRPLDKYVFWLPQNSGFGAGASYDFEQVRQYREGEIPMRTSLPHVKTNGQVDGTDYYDLWIVDPTPLCGVNVCDMPSDLLPSTVTYTPAGGTKWGCDDAVTTVLGNTPYRFQNGLIGFASATTSRCEFRHQIRRCAGDATIAVGLCEFWTLFPLEQISNAVGNCSYEKIDALTWLEESPQSVTKADGTYTFGGTYDPAFRRDGWCLPPAGWPAGGFFGSDFAMSPDRKGQCQRSEYTISVSNVRNLQYIDTIFAPQCAPTFSIEGDYVVLPAQLAFYGGPGACGREAYELVSNVPFRLARLFRYPYAPNTIDGADPCSENTIQSVDVGIKTTSCGFRWNISARCRSTVVQGAVLPPWLIGGAFQDCTEALVLVSVEGATMSSVRADATIEVDGSAPRLHQCTTSDIALSTTEVTKEVNADGRAVLTIAADGYGPADVIVSGNWRRCGWSLVQGNYFLPKGTASAQDYFYNPTDELRTFYSRVMTDGGPPHVITVNVQGKCRTVLLRHTGPRISGGGLDYIMSVANDPGCYELVVETNGASCGWSLSSNADWVVIDEDSVTGTGNSYAKIRVEANPNPTIAREAQVTATLDADQTVKSVVRVRQG